MSEIAKSGRGQTAWGTILGRAGLVGVVAFVVLQAKEFNDAGRLDTPGTGADALLIAGGTFVTYALLRLLKL